MAQKKTDVATTKGQANLPAEMLDQLAGDAGRGMEGAGTEDMVIPFIRVAQALSPEVNKRESEYIEGLEQGDFFNTATRAKYGGEEGFYFVPALYERKYLEFTPRDAGGGFHGEHGPEIMQQTQRGEKGGDMLPNGNEIVVNGTWYGLVVDKETGEYEQAVLAMAKTQLKHSRTLMTQLRSLTLKAPNGQRFNPPLFYNLLHVTSIPESNDQGSWFGYNPKIAGSVLDLQDGAEIYEQAKALAAAVQAGEKKAAAPEESPGSDEDIPF